MERDGKAEASVVQRRGARNKKTNTENRAQEWKTATPNARAREAGKEPNSANKNLNGAGSTKAGERINHNTNNNRPRKEKATRTAKNPRN